MTAAALRAETPPGNARGLGQPAAMARVLPQPPQASRVLIVDDSAVARAVIAREVDGSGRFMVTGAASNVGAALEFLGRTSVDFILLDINMPGVDGLTALPDLIAAGGGARVLVVSAAAAEGAAITVQALALGAADALAKPEAVALSGRFASALMDKLDRLAEPTCARLAPTGVPLYAAPQLRPFRNPFDVVAIGASTGGIHALGQLLREFDAGFRVPVLVTQHLPASFMPYFAAQLALIAGRPCDVATNLMRLRPGRIIIAPGDAHLRCVALGDGAACVRLSREASVSGCTPSVDPMFASVAATFGSRALGVVLTGMGRDGAEGARALREAGAGVVAQDQASSVVWGMPGAVAAAGLAEALLPPAMIGRLMVKGRQS